MQPGSESGCTALVALIKDKKIYVANAGDCRCVVSKNGEAIELSLDHKPENDIELKRIENAGGRVSAGRVNDGLNLSRALGKNLGISSGSYGRSQPNASIIILTN